MLISLYIDYAFLTASYVYYRGPRNDKSYFLAFSLFLDHYRGLRFSAFSVLFFPTVEFAFQCSKH